MVSYLQVEGLSKAFGVDVLFEDLTFGIAEGEPRIKPYYIGEKRLITMMMKMEDISWFRFS